MGQRRHITQLTLISPPSYSYTSPAPGYEITSLPHGSFQKPLGKHIRSSWDGGTIRRQTGVCRRRMGARVASFCFPSVLDFCAVELLSEGMKGRLMLLGNTRACSFDFFTLLFSSSSPSSSSSSNSFPSSSSFRLSHQHSPHVRPHPRSRPPRSSPFSFTRRAPVVYIITTNTTLPAHILAFL